MKKKVLGWILELVGLAAFAIGLIYILPAFIDTPFFSSIYDSIQSSVPFESLILLEALMPFVLGAGLFLLIFGKIICLLADIEYNTRKR